MPSFFKLLLYKLLIFILLILPFSPVAEAASQNIAPGAIVNINRADPETISRHLKGIGPVKAKAIVEYREKYGSYKTVEELADVKGIGEKTVQRLKPFVRIE